MDRLEGARVVLRPAVVADAGVFAKILATDAVARWWTWDDIEGDLTNDEEFHFAIVLGDRVVGMIQATEENEPDYRHAGIDVFLAPDVHGHGHGTDAVRTLARWLIAERGHHRLTIDPDARNAPAIAAYAKVGFKPVGLLRRYWHDRHDGIWSDALLMDLLADELTRD
ncbi:GNAT family N-acetyltransferase [Embleya sp. NBC_00896]|uniref:GNAT family N-acetyltransferase n=1 Tax=Embleya sp. NBC_00896 TaxID=2975961 RepID=UPI00386CEED1|nr:GNAT family N-acetyltransferase [Embleya sp. NBC_00896]